MWLTPSHCSRTEEMGAIVSGLLIEPLIYERPNSIDVLYLTGAHAPTDAYPMNQCIYACMQPSIRT